MRMLECNGLGISILPFTAECFGQATKSLSTPAPHLSSEVNFHRSFCED